MKRKNTGNETGRPSLGPFPHPSLDLRKALSEVTLALITVGAVLVSIAMFNKVPRLVPERLDRPRPGGGVATAQRTVTALRPRLADARLTEQGRAVFTAVGGSALIVAFFLGLSGL